MNTENLHRVLSPDDYASFRERIKQIAKQARRASILQFGLPKLHRLMPSSGLFKVVTPATPPKA